MIEKWMEFMSVIAMLRIISSSIDVYLIPELDASKFIESDSELIPIAVNRIQPLYRI